MQRLQVKKKEVSLENTRYIDMQRLQREEEIPGAKT
jgi:hypothetical protein